MANGVTVSVDGRTAEVPVGTTVLEAAREMGVNIPTLCQYAGVSPYGACRICMVEIETDRGPRLVASCSHPVEAGLVVSTDSEGIRRSRKTILELLLAQAPDSWELVEFARGLGVHTTPYEQSESGKCIMCGLCVRVCDEGMRRNAIGIFGRGAERKVTTPFDEATELCQACGACAIVCPTGAIDLTTITNRRVKPHITEYDASLGPRPSIDLAHPQAAPRVPAIDRESCVKFRTGDCGICSEVCEANAIDYDQKNESIDLEVGAVVLTPGFEAFDATRRGEFGFGFAPNVLTNVQFERMLSASGPTSGHILRPSDGSVPKKLAFIQCVGSRDSTCGNEYCSSVCCMAATKEAIIAKDHEPDLDVTIFFLDLRAFGKDFDRYCERAEKQLGVRYIRSFISRTYEMPHTKNLRLVHMDESMRQVEEEFDMVVLSLGLEPSASLKEQAERFEVALNRFGFAKTSELDPLETSRPGIFVGGAFQEPKDIPDTVMQASAAAAKAMTLLAPARGTRVVEKAYPTEHDITDEPPRIGVFVCHCGSNIASVVDVREVVKRARELPDVVFADHNLYACAEDNLGAIKETIQKNHLNRLIIASCTPRTHEPIFRETMRDAGLNPYLVEMANIRDQCSWVHSSDPANATEKAADLVRMAVSRVARTGPLYDELVPVDNAALIVGGGVAGMTSALALAEQGFPVHLVEKSGRLGGTARHLYKTLDGLDVQAFLQEKTRKVNENELITVHLNSHTEYVEGHIGNFRSTVASNGNRTEVQHGVVVVATGATEQKPTSYAYREDDRVLTQLELSERLGKKKLDLPIRPTVVMIQCVEQRDEEHPYCSRVCCATAVNNALELKRRHPGSRVMVLYRDMRTYGFREVAYREAREKGVLFVRYEPDNPPVVNRNGKLEVVVNEPTLGRDLAIEPDLVVLASRMTPRADRHELSELLRIPLNADGFFLEAHMKLRPVDFASEGIFLCGTAHAPKFLSETISQAYAVAGRAASILSREWMPVSGQIAWVDPDKCISCMTCVHTCPYLAPMVGEDNKAVIQGAVCMGCGSCAAECPARAFPLSNFSPAPVGARGRGRGGGPAGVAGGEGEKNFLERVGIAQTRWPDG